MPRFAILREIDPNMTHADLDAAVLQQLFNLAAVNVPPEQAFNPALAEAGIGWVRSYVHWGTNWGMCLYSARSREDLELYHMDCDVPYVAIDEVEELVSPQFAAANDHPTPAANGAVLVAVEADIVLPEGDPGAAFADVSGLIAQLAGTSTFEGTASRFTWIRTYWNASRSRAVALYAAPDRESADALRLLFERHGAATHDVMEVHPELYTT